MTSHQVLTLRWPQSLKWPLLSKETSPRDLLISRASLAAETPRQIPTVAVPAHSTQEACGQALGALAALSRWGLDMKKLNRQQERIFKPHGSTSPKPPLQGIWPCPCALVQCLKDRKAPLKECRRPWGTSPPDLFLGSSQRRRLCLRTNRISQWMCCGGSVQLSYGSPHRWGTKSHLCCEAHLQKGPCCLPAPLEPWLSFSAVS